MENNVKNRERFFNGDITPVSGERSERFGGLSQIRGNLVHIETLTERTAQGFTVGDNEKKKPFVAVKEFGLVGLGRSARSAEDSLCVVEQSLPWDDRRDAFITSHDKDTMYTVAELSTWHRRLVGSCHIGRELFLREHNLKSEDLSNVRFFLEITTRHDERSKAVLSPLFDYYEGEPRYEVANPDPSV